MGLAATTPALENTHMRTSTTNHAKSTNRPAYSTLNCVTAMMIALATSALPACNTTEGAGKDIEKAGQGIQHAAEKSK